MNYKDEAVLFTTPTPGHFGNIELVAAEIAHLVPELARDNPTNRAEVIKNLIMREQERAANVHVIVKCQPGQQNS